MIVKERADIPEFELTVDERGHVRFAHPAQAHAYLRGKFAGQVIVGQFYPHGGWTAHVEQRQYGHRARKATWLYAYGVALPSLRWGRGPAPEAWISSDRPRSALAARGIGQLGKREAKATPEEFRDVLLAMARTAREVAA